MNSNPELKKRSQWEDVWIRYKKNKVALISLFVFIIFILIVIFADLIVPYQTALQQNLRVRLLPPSAAHWLGTDDFGRDLFARIIHGTRISIFIGLAVTAVSSILGVIIGAASGYYGKWFDSLTMRILDVIMTFPGILLIITLVSFFGIGMTNMIFAMSIAGLPGYARMVRGSVLSIKEIEYIEAARAIGCNDVIIMFKHIVPNVIGPIIINAALSMSGVIIAAAGLSFIGFGVQSPTPEWGAIMSSAKQYMRTAQYFILIPGLFIVTSTLVLTLIGDGLVDALDPRLRN